MFCACENRFGAEPNTLTARSAWAIPACCL